jgi:hypothetical protein
MAFEYTKLWWNFMHRFQYSKTVFPEICRSGRSKVVQLPSAPPTSQVDHLTRRPHFSLCQFSEYVPHELRYHDGPRKWLSRSYAVVPKSRYLQIPPRELLGRRHLLSAAGSIDAGLELGTRYIVCTTHAVHMLCFSHLTDAQAVVWREDQGHSDCIDREG